MRFSARTALVAAILPMALIPVGTRAMPQTVQCTALTRQRLPNTTIIVAQDGLARDSSGSLAFCRILGEIRPTADSQIRFVLWLPVEHWNHKFAGVGNVGFAGGFMSGGEPVGYTLTDQLKRGYATASTDTGHHNGDGGDDRASFALDHREQVIDFAYRAVHEMTLKAKALTEAFYGQRVEHAYWLGMSTGGRQGLMEAQRYPDDYDGIVVGAPPINLTWNWIRQVDAGLVVAKDADHSLVAATALKLLHAAVMKACDRNDGLADGLLEDPRACTFDPAALECPSNQVSDDCLMPTQVEAARRTYAGLKDPMTGMQLNPGLERGSEIAWANAFPEAIPHPAAISYVRYLVIEDAAWDWKTFDFRRPADYQASLKSEARLAPILNALDPDLRAFKRRGGKILHWHGWSDERVESQSSTDYYERVLSFAESGRLDRGAALRDVQSFYRLFMVPGMTHGVGVGYGPNTFDMLTVLEQWVERGISPDAVTATHSTNGVVDRSRPICPYPRVATYKGTGDTNDAANFVCRDPSATGRL
jgi:feruloyl esterase